MTSITDDSVESYSCFVLLGTILIGGIIASSAVIISKKRRNKGKTVPYASARLLETIREFGSPEVISFFLKLAREAQKHGRSCYRLALPVPGGIYTVGDAKLQRQILNEKTTDKPLLLLKSFKSLTGSSESIITSTNNSHWKMVRKTTAPSFSSTEVSRMKIITLNFIENWCEEAKTKFLFRPFDPCQEIVELTFKVFCDAALEYKATNQEYREFSANLENALREYTLKQLANPLRAVFGFMIPDVRKAYQSCLKLHNFAFRVLTAYRENPNKSEQNTVIRLIESMKSLSDKQKIAEIVIYIIGGHDTTGIQIANTLVLLAKNPDIAAKLRADTEGLTPDQWSSSSKYFNQVIKESFRYMPVGALGSARITGKDFDAGNGEIIPKGAIVLINQFLPNRDDNIFQDADTFNPDRWYDATSEMNEAVMPFAAGMRNCVGQSLAKAELETILPNILARFDIQLVEDGVPDFFMTYKFSNSKVQLKERSKTN